jgi:hypothetical protein
MKFKTGTPVGVLRIVAKGKHGILRKPHRDGKEHSRNKGKARPT